jgi:hypothetical protein
MAEVGTAAAGAGAADGGPGGEPVGDLDGDGAVVGADQFSSLLQDSTAVAVWSGALSPVRGARAGSS